MVNYTDSGWFSTGIWMINQLEILQMNWKTRETTTLIDIVSSPEGQWPLGKLNITDSKLGLHSGDDFPGIFAPELDSKCWSLDGKRILITTSWRLTTVRIELNSSFLVTSLNSFTLFKKIISYNLDTKQVVKLENNIDASDSIGLLDFSNDWVCASVKSFNKRAGIVSF